MADTPPLMDVARVAVDDFRRGREALITPAVARELVAAVEIALITAVRGERRACVGECARRGELWQRTAERPGTPEHARLEAEHRANEALYLSDLIASRGTG